MFPPLLIALLLVPLLELYVLIQVSEAISLPLTIVLLIVMSILGAWLLKREGLATWRRAREAMARGTMPTAELTDGVMILFGAALMLTPGFITDVFGLLLILPPTRVPLKGAFRRVLGGWFLTRSGFAGKASRGVYAARSFRTKRASPPTPPTAARSAPSLEHPDDEVDSPGRA